MAGSWLDSPNTDEASEPMAPGKAEAYALEALRGGPTARLYEVLRSFEGQLHPSYRRVIESAANGDQPHPTFSVPFRLNWSERAFVHRAQLADDALLVRAFRRIFPPYIGRELVLYRGERAAEYDAGRRGLNWSSDRSRALCFARGRCTEYVGGGVLLEAKAPAAAIIARPHEESIRQGEHEYIVEPALLSGIVEQGRFPFNPN